MHVDTSPYMLLVFPVGIAYFAIWGAFFACFDGSHKLVRQFIRACVAIIAIAIPATFFTYKLAHGLA